MMLLYLWPEFVSHFCAALTPLVCQHRCTQSLPLSEASFCISTCSWDQVVSSQTKKRGKIPRSVSCCDFISIVCLVFLTFVINTFQGFRCSTQQRDENRQLEKDGGRETRGGNRKKSTWDKTWQEKRRYTTEETRENTKNDWHKSHKAAQIQRDKSAKWVLAGGGLDFSTTRNDSAKIGSMIVEELSHRWGTVSITSQTSAIASHCPQTKYSIYEGFCCRLVRRLFSTQNGFLSLTSGSLLMPGWPEDGLSLRSLWSIQLIQSTPFWFDQNLSLRLCRRRSMIDN